MWRILAVMTVVVVAAVLTSCGSDDADSTGSSSGPNDTDVEFAQQMIPHHAQAVEMSDIVLAKDGLDPEVADLAEQIKAAQAPEIGTTTGWLTEWGEQVPPTIGMEDMEGMAMNGMMSADDMADLQDADAAQAARLFLQQMTEHHTGAIDMAEQEVEAGSYPDAITLAETIIDSQQAEITQMEQLLGRL